jgi:hypothetical protein
MLRSSTLQLDSTSEVPFYVPSPRWHRLLSLVLLTTFLASCVNWHVEGPTPEAAINKVGESKVRITRTDGTKLTLWSTVVKGDSIVGQPKGFARPGPRMAVPLADVTEVATPHTDGFKTAGAVLGTAAAALFIVGGVFLLTYEDQS